MDPATWTFLILAVAIVAFVSGRVPLAVVSLGVALALWATVRIRIMAPPRPARRPRATSGEVAEWSIVPDSKSGKGL